MSTAQRQDTLAAPLYPARASDPDRFHRLLPADVRRRDLVGGGVLQSLLRVLESQYDLLEADVGRLYDDESVETCRAELLAYFADLLGLRLPRTAPGVEVGGAADAARAARQASLLRRLAGGLVASRRRKGSVAEARRLARLFGHTSSYLVETIWRIDRSPAVRRPAGLDLAASEFGPSVRGAAGPPAPGSPYGRFALTAEVRRVLSRPGVTPGRAHPNGLEVHLGRLNSYKIERATAHVVEMDDDPYLYLGTFDPMGASVPLLTSALTAPGPGEAVGESHFVGPIRRAVMAARLLDYYGEGKSVEVWVNGASVPHHQVQVADLPDATERGGGRSARWDLPPTALASGRLLIDPERGRLALRLEDPEHHHPKHKEKHKGKHKEEQKRVTDESPVVQVTYFTGLIGNLGGGGYPRRLREVVVPEKYIVVDPRPSTAAPSTSQTNPPRIVKTLDEALRLFEHYAGTPGARVVIELRSNSTFPWTRDEVHIPAGARLTVRAASGVWPLIWAGGHRDRAERVKFVGDEPEDGDEGGPVARLVLDGLRIAGRALHLEDNLRAVIRDTTLVPGWVPPNSADVDHPGAASLSLHGVRAGVVIDRSILGRIQVLPKELDDPTPLVLRDSIIDAGVPERFALAGAERHQPHSYHHADGELPHAYAALVLRRTTVFGRVRVYQVVLAADSLLTGRCEVARRQTGCLRFCYLPFDSATPPRYRCQPDLARAELRRRAAGETATADPIVDEHDPRLALLGRRLEPAFASRHYGNPFYAALHAGAPPEVRTGAEDGGEFGAFHDLDLPARDLELLDRLADAVPAGIDVRLIIHPGTVS